MIAVYQSELYRNLFSGTLNDLREGVNLICSGRLFQRQAHCKNVLNNPLEVLEHTLCLKNFSDYIRYILVEKNVVNIEEHSHCTPYT